MRLLLNIVAVCRRYFSHCVTKFNDLCNILRFCALYIYLIKRSIMDTGEIILYQPDSSLKLEVRLNKETVWLNRQQMAVLFNRDVKTIGKHINNALAEELNIDSVVANFATTHFAPQQVVAKFATTAADGKTYQVEYYSLDVILSVGYRVKSKQGILFRQWANTVLKDYLLRGYSINQRLLNIERKVEEHDSKIDFFVRTSLPPVEGIFFDGQVFDAYRFVSDLVRSAKQRIALFDNYIDDTVLSLLDKREPAVEATIYTKSISSQLALDLKRHNSQYRPITITQFDRVHDRFLCIDDTVYHVGASLKDLGKKWFAFSRLEMPASELINKTV